MRYGKTADIMCDTLVMPQAVVTVEEETSSGTQMKSSAKDYAKAGEAFELSFIAQNIGEVFFIIVDVYVDVSERRQSGYSD